MEKPACVRCKARPIITGATSGIGCAAGGRGTPSNAVRRRQRPGATLQTRAFVEGLHALKRFSRPQEIAAALYLALDASIQPGVRL
jgi:hypothetical protein